MENHVNLRIPEQIREMGWKRIALCFLAVAIMIHAPIYLFDLLRTHDGNFHRVNSLLLWQNLSLTAPTSSVT